MPDAMGAAGKQVGVVWSRLIACIHTIEVERPDGSPKVDFAVLLLLRSEEPGRYAYMGANKAGLLHAWFAKHSSLHTSRHSPLSEPL